MNRDRESRGIGPRDTGLGAARQSALDAFVRERIRSRGPITFAEFVAIALYHPDGGYYTADRVTIGRSGDYLTAPETHPLFGALLARQVIRMADLIGPISGPFRVVELGAGTGALAAALLDLCRSVAPDLYHRLRYQIVEISPALRAAQADRLADHAARVDWVELADLPAGSVTGVFLANEFFDALPFHRVARQDGELHEIYVDLDDGELVDRLGPLSRPELREYFERLAHWPPEGGQIEVTLQATGVLERIGDALARGALITIDYGYEVEEWLGKVRPRGTFLAHHRHTTNDEPYRRIGRQDLTAHVDFTTLAEAGRRVGLAPLGPIDQGSYLMALGLPAYADALAAAGGRLPLSERRRNLEAIAALVDPAGLGAFKVLVQTRGLPDLTLDQMLAVPEARIDPGAVPLLPPDSGSPDPPADLWREAFGTDQ